MDKKRLLKNKIKLVLNIFLLGFFVYLLNKIDFKIFFTFFETINFQIWILIIILFIFLYFIKSIRFYVLNKNLPLSKLFSISIYHNFFIMLLPFKLGEVIYIKKLKENNIKITKSVGDILVLRAYDLIIIMFFIISTILFRKNIFSILNYFELSLIFILTILFIFNTNLFYKLLIKLSKKNNLKSLNWIVKKLIEILEPIKNIKFKNKIYLLILTLIVWSFSLSIWIILLSLLIEISFLDILIAVLMVTVISFLPINPPIGAGIIEGSWILGLYLVGVSSDFAMAFSIFAHTVYVLTISLIFIGFVSLKKLL
tara:strand:+ start:952 stop:1887 length:936 start_codon:yes stop_codon:yes gene_type:complete